MPSGRYSLRRDRFAPVGLPIGYHPAQTPAKLALTTRSETYSFYGVASMQRGVRQDFSASLASHLSFRSLSRTRQSILVNA
jgi:hypothetical protein